MASGRPEGPVPCGANCQLFQGHFAPRGASAKSLSRSQSATFCRLAARVEKVEKIVGADSLLLKPAGSRRVFATSEPLRCSGVMKAKRRNWETGSRVRGRTESCPGRLSYCLRLPCAPGRYRANSAYTPRRLRERRVSTSSGFARLSRHMQEYATQFQLSSSTCASLREALPWHHRELFSSIRLIQAEKPPSPFFLTRTRPLFNFEADNWSVVCPLPDEGRVIFSLHRTLACRRLRESC
jgi:hypothetical protein